MDIADFYLTPSKFATADARAGVDRELAKHYRELRGSLAKPAPPFSLSKVLRRAAEGRAVGDYEQEVLTAAALLMGHQYDSNRICVPFGALTRTMTAQPGAKGGYSVGVETTEPADVLRPWSVVASAGAQLLTGLRDSLAVPRVTTATTAGWVGEYSAASTETPPTLGQASMAPKTAIALVKFSVQLLRQSASVDQFIANQLLRAVGELLDVAFFAGAGGVAPLGLLNTAGIGTQSGTSLAHAGILAMRQAVLTAGGREDMLQWVGPPIMQTLLGGRERATGGGQFLWHDSTVLGHAAHATKNAPASTLVVGDFSQAVIGVWGPGLMLEIDPSQDFNTAGLVARVLLFCDVAFPQPAAFCVASSIT